MSAEMIGLGVMALFGLGMFVLALVDTIKAGRRRDLAFQYQDGYRDGWRDCRDGNPPKDFP